MGDERNPRDLPKRKVDPTAKPERIDDLPEGKPDAD